MPEDITPDADGSAILVELVDSPQDIEQGFDCLCATFGRQTRDGAWIANNPGWDTPDGKARAVARMVARWRGASRNAAGDPNTVFLKATAPDARHPGRRVIAGFAIWLQASAVTGHGDAPPEDISTVVDLDAIYPGDEREHRYLRQLDYGLHRQRIELVKAKAAAEPPAVMVLDLCIVDPVFQRRGIAQRLVRWGLDEAERRGGLEAVTEASPMGRTVYAKLGFHQEGPEIDYGTDPEFADRDKPSNIFMRTRP
jgi:GNAT superfamily N-acetyltransferase